MPSVLGYFFFHLGALDSLIEKFKKKLKKTQKVKKKRANINIKYSNFAMFTQLQCLKQMRWRLPGRHILANYAGNARVFGVVMVHFQRKYTVYFLRYSRVTTENTRNTRDI